ncbi:MAG: CPBP family intramembrane glutamic endopeptidase [Saccharofermentanales bacterium]
MKRERFSLRTIVIPVAAVAGFYIIQISVALIYSIIYSIVLSASGQIPETDIITGMEKTLIQQSNNMGAIYSVIIAIIAMLAMFFLLKGNPKAVRREKPGIGAIFSSVIIIVGISGFISLQMVGLSALGEFVPFIDTILKHYTELAQAFVGDGNVAMIIISTCILIPIAEELVFRGIIQGELRRVFPGWATIIIQAVIFALVHGNIVQISYVIFPALILGLVYEWTKSIYVPIALHMIFNFIGSALPQMLGQNDNAVMYLYVAQIAFIPAAIIGIFYLKSKRFIDPDMSVQQDIQTLQPVPAVPAGYTGADDQTDPTDAYADADSDDGTADETADGIAVESADPLPMAETQPLSSGQPPAWKHRDSV